MEARPRSQPQKSAFRIASIEIADDLGRDAPEFEQERKVAVYDLLQENHFRPKASPGGPYHLILAAEENRLVLDVRLRDRSPHGRFILSLAPFRRVLKDYHALCQSYYAALGQASPARVEAIDMGRRSLHDDGSQLLRERLRGKIEMDFPTARRLFTLISALCLKA